MNMEAQSWREADIAEGEDVAASKRTRRWVMIGLAIVVLVIAASLIFRHRGDKAAADAAAPQAAPAVTVIVPGRRPVTAAITTTGSLAAKREEPVGVPGEGGQVTRVLVETGDWVKAGQTLATIERSVQAEQASQLAAQIDAVRADAAIAQSNLDRGQSLVARGFISKANIDQLSATRDAALARVRVAQAQLGQQRAQIGRLDIRAPSAGLVLARAVEPGQVVGPSSGALFRIARDGEMELRAQVAEQDLARLAVGRPATVTPVGSTTPFTGHIWQMPPVVDPGSRQGIVRIALPFDRAIRPGGFASASLAGGTVAAPVLPQSAVLTADGASYVYVVGPDNKVVRRTVTVGDVDDRGASIVAGLQGDERVVASAGAFLNPGDPITPTLARTAH